MHGCGSILPGGCVRPFSKNVARVLWANDQGAKLFGTTSVYDFIDTDLDPSDLSLRQLRAAAAQLAAVGDRRQLLIRMASGFRRLPLNAAVELIRIGPGEEAILFTVPNNGKALSTEARAEAMIAGLDGPDTHMAVLDADGTVIAGSPGFESLGLSADIRRTLVAAAASDKDRLIKRPVATEKGRLPAAVGKISDHPALHLLFAVEAILEKSETGEAVGAAAAEQAIPAAPAAPAETREAVPSSAAPAETEQPAGRLEEAEPAPRRRRQHRQNTKRPSGTAPTTKRQGSSLRRTRPRPPISPSLKRRLKQNRLPVNRLPMRTVAEKPPTSLSQPADGRYGSSGRSTRRDVSAKFPKSSRQPSARRPPT